MDKSPPQEVKLPIRIPLKEGLEFTIRAAITDVAVFNHYILKEYAPKCQGVLGISKAPAKHTLENCLYDEVCGWLDSPTLTGLAILEVNLGPVAFKNYSLNADPKLNFREIVNLLYDTSKVGTPPRKGEESVLVSRADLEQLKSRAKHLLKYIDKVGPNGQAPEISPSVGSRLREKRIPGGLPSSP